MNASDIKPVDVCDEQSFSLFYERITQLYTLSRESLHNTHQWVTTIAIATVTAVLALKEVQTSPAQAGTVQTSFPNELAVLGFLAMVPLMFRFLVRSCLEDAIQHRFMAIRNAQDYVCYNKGTEQAEDARRYYHEVMELYYFRWLSPKTLRELLWENFQLSYSWPFILLIAFLVWGVASVRWTPLLWIGTGLVVLFMSWEVVEFLTYNGYTSFKPHATPPPPMERSVAQIEGAWAVANRDTGRTLMLIAGIAIFASWALLGYMAGPGFTKGPGWLFASSMCWVLSAVAGLTSFLLGLRDLRSDGVQNPPENRRSRVPRVWYWWRLESNMVGGALYASGAVCALVFLALNLGIL
jgi:hypothetical protein